MTPYIIMKILFLYKSLLVTVIITAIFDVLFPTLKSVDKIGYEAALFKPISAQSRANIGPVTGQYKPSRGPISAQSRSGECVVAVTLHFGATIQI